MELSQDSQHEHSEGEIIKTDPKSPLWQYVEIIGKNPGGGSFKWNCNECQDIKNGSYTRVKAHLTGQTNTGVQVCTRPKDANGKPDQGLSPGKMKFYAALQEAADRKLAKGKHLVQSSTTRPPLPSKPGAISNKRATLGPPEACFNNQGRDIADEHVACCIYANGLAFNLVRSPYWQQMIKAVNEAPKGYKSPGYEKVRTTLLASERQSVDRQLQGLWDTWAETGVSIISDGWRDQRNRPLINVVAVCPQGAMFLKAVDCSGIEKDASFISTILIEAIESVGLHNVVQVITDNAHVCKAAGLIVEGRYDHIFWTPCAVHSLNLMLAKIGEIEWINEIYVASKEIQTFITNHSMSQDIYQGFAKLELLKVAETHFASHTLVIKRLVEVRQALQAMVIDPLWESWRTSTSDRGQKIKSIILDDAWWDKVQYLLRFIEPILTLIRAFDTDTPCLGEVYENIDSMLERIRELIRASENDPYETFYYLVKEIVTERWNKMTTPLHLLAYALHPKYYHSKFLSLPGRTPPNKDSEVVQGYKTTLKKIYRDMGVAMEVRQEFGGFVQSTGSFLDPVAMDDRGHLDPITWWGFHVKRNRLGAANAEDLVYVHSNLCLLSHVEPEYKKGPSRMWDVEPEISDLNLTLNAMTHLNLLEDIVPPPVQPTDATSYIPGPPSSIHDVELQYAEDIDPFDDL
eukprot:PITA_10692